MTGPGACRARSRLAVCSAPTLYLFMQSFLLRAGRQSEMQSHRSLVLAGYVFSACSSSFCSSVVQGAGLVPSSNTCCSATPEHYTMHIEVSDICANSYWSQQKINMCLITNGCRFGASDNVLFHHCSNPYQYKLAAH